MVVWDDPVDPAVVDLIARHLVAGHCCQRWVYVTTHRGLADAWVAATRDAIARRLMAPAVDL